MVISDPYAFISNVTFIRLVQIATGLDCFSCNAFVPGTRTTCPANQTENVDTWKKKFDKYKSFSTAKFCQIRVKKSDGSIITQVRYT